MSVILFRHGFDRDLDWSRERPPIIECESRVPVKNCHDCFTDAIYEPNYSPFSFSPIYCSFPRTIYVYEHGLYIQPERY